MVLEPIGETMKIKTSFDKNKKRVYETKEVVLIPSKKSCFVKKKRKKRRVD